MIIRGCRILFRNLIKWVISGGLRLTPLNLVRVLFEESMVTLHHRGPDFITHRMLPKCGNSGPYHDLNPIMPMPSGLIGLVIQGPLLLEDNFTLESVRYYLRVKHSLVVIVSTWEGEDSESIEKIRQLGAEVVLNKKPPCTGRCNVNYQVVSTLGGINRAMELGCLFVAKTRSDQRIYCLSALMSLPQMLDQFPIRNAPAHQKKRLVFVSRVTSKYGPFFLSDFFSFGLIEDMHCYWDQPMDPEKIYDLYNKRHLSNTYYEYVKCSPENYLISNYFMKGKIGINLSLKVWWELLADRFCIINWHDLDLYWPKYHPNHDRQDLREDHLFLQTVNMIDWLALTFTESLSIDENKENKHVDFYR